MVSVNVALSTYKIMSPDLKRMDNGYKLKIMGRIVLFISVMPVFLSYLYCITNHSLKNLLNRFRRSRSRSPPPDFPPSRHRAVSSSFSVEPPVPFPFPPAPPSHRITIMSRSTACACPTAIVSAARVPSFLFSYFVQIHFISLF
jgi:hypothetical protein